MWLTSKLNLDRSKSFEFNGFKPSGRANWRVKAPYGSSLCLNPFGYAYALIRTSAVGRKLNAQGYISGGALALASMAYISPSNKGGLTRLCSNFHGTKDFIGHGLKGMIGAAISYLDMIDQGYPWVGHWEDCISHGASLPTLAHPDFVFGGSSGACLTDAKGSAAVTIDYDIKTEWRRQILPHLGSRLALGGSVHEGMVIATKLPHANASSLIRAKGRLLPPLGKKTKTGSASPESGEISTVQRANYADVFHMLGLDELAQALIKGPESNSAQGTRLEFQINLQPSRYFASYEIPFLLGKETWSIRPFCKTDMIHAVLDKFLSQDYLEAKLPVVTQQGLDISEEPSTHVSHESDGVLIQGPDGVGALFRRLSKQPFSYDMF